jgi:hypothetical protein
MKNISGESIYSRTILLAASADSFFFISVINPFSSNLQFNVAADHSGTAEATLIDPSGRTVIEKTFVMAEGINSLVITNTGQLASGIYFLRLQSGTVSIQKKVFKEPK